MLQYKDLYYFPFFIIDLFVRFKIYKTRRNVKKQINEIYIKNAYNIIIMTLLYETIISNYEYDIIKLTDNNDIAFANIAQLSKVTNATLPSGFKVPDSGNWVIYKTFIINIPKELAMQTS